MNSTFELTSTFESWFTKSAPSIPFRSVKTVIELQSEGATIPFIARYRKEATGNLDEVTIEKIIRLKERWETIIKRQAAILSEIEKQGKLTEELKQQISNCYSLDALEDYYLPFRQKRRTKAELAREAGLAPLAEWIWNCGHGTDRPLEGQTLELWAFTFRNEEKGFREVENVLSGACDILVERISEHIPLRELVRNTVFKLGAIKTSKGEKAKENSKYESYFSYQEPISSLLKPENSHRFLALRRGWKEGELSLKVDSLEGTPSMEELLLPEFEAFACTEWNSPGADILKKAARLAFKVHVFPSVQNEVLKQLKESADEAAIEVFSKNVRQVLMAPPLGEKSVLGIDPGVRTGCKLAWVDASGKYLRHDVIYLHTVDATQKSKALLACALKEYPVEAIAIGNGTHGRETSVFVRKLLHELGLTIPVVMVSESGASIYSASEIAREEFPDLDLTVRGAISIARRLQDPLAELVKIDPKSIGVGQYQHDVNQAALERALHFVVEACVNQVGVNLNTASYCLLSFVSGIGPTLAKNIVEYRNENGPFQSREDLKKVPRFSDRVFEQAAGFLRIAQGSEVLDNTGIHPERYAILKETAQKLGYSLEEWIGKKDVFRKVASALKDKIGEFTFNDIVAELEKPGRDIRSVFVPVQFRDDVFSLADLKEGMICPGIVTNVTNFGAFVDIGVHQDGLVHISEISAKFIKDPKEVISVGSPVTVKVIEINREKNQISLSIKQVQQNPKSKEKPHVQPGANPHSKSTKGVHPAPKRRAASTPKPAFNNPFGSLASLKAQLKKG